MVEPVAVSVEVRFGKGFIKRLSKIFTEGASFFPSVTFDGEAFEGSRERIVVQEGVGGFVKEEKGEVGIVFFVIDGFFGAEGKFFTRFKNEVGEGGDELVQKGEMSGGHFYFR